MSRPPCPSCGGGRLRLDGTCPFELCVKFRKSKRALCSGWLNVTDRETEDLENAKNPVKHSQRTPLRRIKKRFRCKQAPSTAATPAVKAVFTSSHNNNVSIETQTEALAGPEAAGCLSSSPPSTASPSSSSSSLYVAGGAAEAAAAIQDMIEQCMLVPERKVGTLNCMFQLRTATFEPCSFKNGSLKYLSALVAYRYSVEVAALGEPRALALYSSISGILQQLPANAMFSPAESYLAALFYIAWELAGTASAEPAIIRSAPQKDVMACVFNLMNYMLAE